MIGSSLQKASRARSDTARPLALFLAISVFDGLYFPKELLFFGFALSLYLLVVYLQSRYNFATEVSSTFGLTDCLLIGMFLLSILGVLHPIKVQEGLIEALRWGILWFAYRLGVRIASEDHEKAHLAQYIEGVAIVVAIIGWLPYVSKSAGRLSSVIGYPNATATLFGVALLLYPKRKFVQIFLGMSLLATGSRAGVGLFLVVFTLQQILLGLPSFFKFRQRLKVSQLKALGAILLALVSSIVMFLYNKPVWKNLTTGGFSSSSWQERLVYYKDGITLAWNAGGLPQAGGWMAFPTVQRFPYWTADPHSSFIHVLLNQGVLGIVGVSIWLSYCFLQAWKYWRIHHLQIKARLGSEETKAQVRVSGALLFLGLHSLVDADFSFASLGFLFWMLFGSLRRRQEPTRPFLLRNRLATHLSNKGMFVLSITLCLLSGTALLKPNLLERAQSYNAQAVEQRENDPARSMALWQMSLNWDQTQVGTRREQAALLLREGSVENGLMAVEAVLHWQPFDLKAYEWAQSIVWDTAEAQRSMHPEKAMMLYHWVEAVPKRIEEKVAVLTPTERSLWRGYPDFLPTPHIKLIAEYARQRQLPLAR